MYAVVSDIHGNLEALEAVIADVPDGIREINCLGDVIGYGASPNECCNLVRSYGMPVISGNYVLAENEQEGPRIAYRFVEYDVEKAQDKIRAAGLPGMLADRLAYGR